jgi:hypothetical protein
VAGAAEAVCGGVGGVWVSGHGSSNLAAGGGACGLRGAAMTVQYRELVLLEKLQELTAPDADFDYSVLRGKISIEEVRIIREGLQVAIDHLQEKSGKTPK